MNPIELKQQTPEWLKARIGKCTGSRVKDALSFLKNGQPSQKRKDYLTDVVTERLTGFAVEHYVTPAMQWGIDTEEYASSAYEVVSGNDVEEVGIAEHPSIPMFSASPDRYVGNDGIVEIKCPITTTHVEWMMAGLIPEEHLWQLTAEMACSGRKWVDFVSFDPRLPPRNQVFIRRLLRDEERIAFMEAGVIQFLSEVDAMVAKLGGMEYAGLRADAIQDSDDGVRQSEFVQSLHRSLDEG